MNEKRVCGLITWRRDQAQSLLADSSTCKDALKPLIGVVIPSSVPSTSFLITTLAHWLDGNIDKMIDDKSQAEPMGAHPIDGSIAR